ncbi:MAG TPA: hypothetical protein VIX41_11035 [Acidimicrobiales bacterium]
MTRKFLVPLQLPANPTQPLEAATKQYVDLMNEVEISTTEPTDPNVVLWYDPDAV